METLTDRITRYLFARIRRLAILDLYERASVVGLLEADFIVAGDETTGTVWRVPEQSLRLLDADPAWARAELMRRLGKAPYRTTAIDVLIRDIPGEPPHENVRSAPKGRTDRENHAACRRPKSGADAASSVSEAPSASSEFLALLREQLAPPSVAHVAVALLVARAVGSSVPDLSVLSAALRNPGAFVLIKAPVGRFERRFGLMLEDGLILPYWTKLEDVHRSSPLSDGYGDRRRGKTRKTIKTLAGTDVPKAVERSLSRFLVDVLLERSAPVVLADETKTALPPFVSMTADLVLESGGLDHELIAELLQTCCGIAPKQSLRQMEKMALDLEGLSIDALALAVRPGRGLDSILSILEVLGERARSSDKSDDDDDDGRNSGRGSDRSGRPKVKSRFLIKDGDDPPKSVDGIDVVQPEKLAETSGKEGSGSASVDPANPEHSRLRQLRVERLSGYGDAHGWALDLKTDLQLWRDGGLAWSEMSTKLMLSGSPGTGKTTYARALCNTLQVPLLVTSVASWLEPGYLGDVLKRMSKAFELARENAPVILFIDEIDNIGSRSAGRREQHDDYWHSLINRLLELLDGTSKTDGVIVIAATNLPEKIDPALLRSGRLEKHVAIPLPDMEALAGILAHHLGDDLAGVLASAPSCRPKTIETARQQQVHVGGDADVIDQSNRGVSQDA
ncbi:ATP-binding protein [Agrobacterium sp. O3.4]|uniref:AAA family ATPase n=2 Tax=Rhizobium/Agrobacterium group TaxID=227290 RepID=A0A546XNG4_RHIRH|nr:MULTISPECIES: ATP-binding protein [Rhizobium/Agrobacterium group]MCZ7468154.1 ATP-binding protein [Rhizobium rhizogenes]TRB02292.1 AAA family ATPase [Rhizobium rhizogenes]WHO08700.1 ATP-binding protein [Agrobacterium cucumeris]